MLESSRARVFAVTTSWEEVARSMVEYPKYGITSVRLRAPASTTPEARS